MNRSMLGLAGFFLIMLLSVEVFGGPSQGGFTLPQPSYSGEMSVERAIKGRRTVRSFRPDSLSIVQLSQLLWAAQGVTDSRRGLRSAPSAGAIYPLDIYAVVGKGGVEALGSGVYRYRAVNHSLEVVLKEDRRKEVAHAALTQMWVATAPVVFVITAQYDRITSKYGERGIRYAHIEAGHVGENIILQAEAIGLAAGIVGAFRDEPLAHAIGAQNGTTPLLVLPVGYQK